MLTIIKVYAYFAVKLDKFFKRGEVARRSWIRLCGTLLKWESRLNVHLAYLHNFFLINKLKLNKFSKVDIKKIISTVILLVKFLVHQ